MSEHDEAIGQFCGVTGADEERARGLLEACDWNVELAVNMHVDTQDNKPSTSAKATGPSTSIRSTGPSSSNRAFGPSTSKSKSEDDLEDQEIRPPIPPVRQVLVQNPQRRYNNRSGAVSDVFDVFRDFQAEAQWQETENEQGSAAGRAGLRTIEDLFRPPLEVIFHGSFDSAREVGKHQYKWLLVNIQNSKEFACQTLNRDLWSDPTVKDFVKEHFIFWQVYHDSSEGQRYIQFYNVSKFPHVAIIDPRTGEQLKSWPKIDHTSFRNDIIEFLSEHPSLDGSIPDANNLKKLRVKEEENAKTLYDQSEEAQLEAAIKASLQETEDSNSSKAYVDDDSYTDAIESDTDQTPRFGKTLNNTITLDEEEPEEDNEGEVEEIEEEAQPRLNSNGERFDNEEVEDYKKYLGTDTNVTELVIRFPCGSRDKLKFPSDSSLKALFLLLASRGYSMRRYNYVTNFPKTQIHELPSTLTLHDSNLNNQNIFVERKADPEG